MGNPEDPTEMESKPSSTNTSANTGSQYIAEGIDRNGAGGPVGTISAVHITQKVQWREAWVDWTQVIANILVPLAIGIAAFGLYLDNIQGNRDAASRQMELFYSEGLSSAQLTLFKLWRGQDLTVLEGTVSRRFMDEFVRLKIDASEIDRDEIISAVVSLTSYFDRVEICIASGRCDEAELLDQIGSYGRDFFCVYTGQINALRNDRLVNYLGVGLQNFAKRAGGCEG